MKKRTQFGTLNAADLQVADEYLKNKLEKETILTPDQRLSRIREIIETYEAEQKAALERYLAGRKNPAYTDQQNNDYLNTRSQTNANEIISKIKKILS